MITEEEEKEMRLDIERDRQAQKQEWENAKALVKDLIHPKYFQFIESHDSFGDQGIVEIIKTDEKQSGYPDSQRNCRVKDDTSSYLYMHTTSEVESFFGDELKYDGESIEYWVTQWTGYACDDYQGYLLLELSNGKYWKIRYSC